MNNVILIRLFVILCILSPFIFFLIISKFEHLRRGSREDICLYTILGFLILSVISTGYSFGEAIPSKLQSDKELYYLYDFVYVKESKTVVYIFNDAMVKNVKDILEKDIDPNIKLKKITRYNFWGIILEGREEFVLVNE